MASRVEKEVYRYGGDGALYASVLCPFLSFCPFRNGTRPPAISLTYAIVRHAVEGSRRRPPVRRSKAGQSLAARVHGPGGTAAPVRHGVWCMGTSLVWVKSVGVVGTGDTLGGYLTVCLREGMELFLRGCLRPVERAPGKGWEAGSKKAAATPPSGAGRLGQGRTSGASPGCIMGHCVVRAMPCVIISARKRPWCWCGGH